MSAYMKILVFAALATLASALEGSKGYGPGLQDWGWIELRKGIHMFYWLYYTTASVDSVQERPLVVWLQGGPGSSSTAYGNFAEIGTLHTNGSEREYAWTKEVNVLYIDSPAGSGFSFVDDLALLPKNNSQIGEDLTAFLTEFYKSFPVFHNCSLYIFGESYGGKMAVETAKQLYDSIKAGKLDINFKGVVLIDPWISPIDSILGYAPVLFYRGHIDERSYRKILCAANRLRDAINNGEWRKAEELYVAIYGDYDIPVLMNGTVREALKIPPQIEFRKPIGDLKRALVEDFMKPALDVVSHLLDNTDLEVTIISSQLGFIVNTYGTLRWIDALQWCGRSEWASAKKQPFVVDGIIEGYLMKAMRLSFYFVNRSGRMVPTDNPKAAMAILKEVVKIT